jgi:precorrin-6A/cobalt-precorrin-6A reductase
VILLLGGTSDTDPIARALVSRGQKVLVSTVTDYPLTLMNHTMIQKRTGALDEDSLRQLLGAYRIVAIVDATHPYTELIGLLSRRVAEECAIPYFRFMRPESRLGRTNAFYADGHLAAARIACSFNRPILLTIGSKKVGPYVQAAREGDIPLFIRVLDRSDSIDTCLSEGAHAENIIAGKGPFTVEDNLALIRRFDIGVLVTKESGEAGGVKEKVEAADSAGCRLVVVSRPQTTETDTYVGIDTLISEIFRTI